MSTYVRLKNDVDRVVWTSDTVYSLEKHGLVDKKDILDQSDQIVDLIDQIVFEKTLFLPKIFDIADSEEKCIESDYTMVIEDKDIEEGIYGSVWVGADLIAVAKMNKRRELELL